ncbi:MAG: ABC transporter permease [Ramlibacter sp.]|nr:ABC transporter permease [Ramlibacter sp.]
MFRILFSAGLRVLTQAGFVAVVVGVLSFFLTRSLPGDAAFRIAAGRYGYDNVNAASAAAVRAELGLDLPAWQQLLTWVGDLASFRLGQSMVSGESVFEHLAPTLGATLHLSLAAWVLAVVLGVVLGTIAEVRRGWIAHVIDKVCTVLRGSPPFLIGLLLMLGLAVHLKWLPVAGYGDTENVVLPALTLALALCGGIAQVVRSRLEQVLASDAFEFAQIKGLPLGAALWRHAAPAVALPTLAYSGVQLILLIEGVVVVETLFAWPGVGHALVHSVVERDVPVIQGAALLMGLLFVVLNTLVDTAVKLLDPRQREGNGAVASEGEFA